MENASSCRSSVPMASKADWTDHVISLSDEGGPFESSVVTELDEPDQGCDALLDESKHDAKPVAVNGKVLEVAQSLEHNEEICPVQHAYSKVAKLHLGAYSRASLQSQTGPVVPKFPRPARLIQTTSARHRASSTPNRDQVPRRTYG